MLNRAIKKIAALIAAGYILALLLVVALGLLAISGMETLNRIAQDIYEHPFKASNAALEAKAAITQSRNRALLITLFDDPTKIEEWSAEIATLDKDAKEQLSIVKSNFLGDKRHMEEAETLLKQWQGVRNHAIELSRQGRHGEAKQLLMENSLELFSRLRKPLEYVIDFSKQTAASFVAESETKALAEKKRAVWFLSSVLAIIGLIGWSVMLRVNIIVLRVRQLEKDWLESQYKTQNAAYARNLIETSLDPLVTISPQGKITDVNRATEQVTGRNRDELVGTDFAEYFTEPGKAHEGYRQVFSEGAVVDYPLSIRHREGHITEVLYNASVYRDESGNVLGVFAAARDVTEHNRLAKEKEQYQIQNAAYTRSLIEASLDPLVTISPAGKITDVNRATEKATGRSRDELVGTDFAEYFTEPGKAHEGYRTVFAEGAVVDYPLSIRHRQGHITEVLYNASLYRDEAGNVLGVFATARDVTEHNRLAREKEQYYKFFRLSPDPMGIADPFGCFKHVNPAFARLTGYTEGELVAKPFLDFVLPEDRQKTAEEMELQVTRRPSFHFENRYLCKDGRVLFLVWTAYFDKHEGVTYATAHDHTEFRAAEDALREKEERLALATLKNGVGVWDWNLQTQAMIWDDSMYALYQIRREDFSGTEEAWRAALHPDDLERGDREVEDAIAGRKPFETEFRIVWPDGEVRHIKAVAKVFRDEQGTPARMLGINMDVTERKQAEARLAASESRLRAIIETEPDCIKVVDSGGRLRQMNPAGLAMIEADSFEQVAGQPVLGLIAPAYRQSYAQMHERVLAGQPQKMQYVMIGLKGSPLWLETHAVPMLDGAEVVHLAITRDITDRKQAEEKIHQINAELERRVMERTAELEAANKELEAFSYSVSHDLRTPLRAIDGFSLILLEDYASTLDEEGQRLLNVVRNNTARMSQLIDDILRFSRAGRTGMSFTDIDMEKMVRDCVDGLTPLLAGRAVQINVGGLPGIVGDRAMLHQVIENLLSNAIKFSGKQGEARIDIGGAVEGGNAVYYVRDNGVGFNMQYAEKLFGVFQRLHGVDEFDGTGIGLAIVKRVIARHGGRVWAEGEVGKGAAFYFSIPIQEH